MYSFTGHLHTNYQGWLYLEALVRTWAYSWIMQYVDLLLKIWVWVQYSQLQVCKALPCFFIFLLLRSHNSVSWNYFVQWNFCPLGIFSESGAPFKIFLKRMYTWVTVWSSNEAYFSRETILFGRNLKKFR